MVRAFQSGWVSLSRVIFAHLGTNWGHGPWLGWGWGMRVARGQSLGGGGVVGVCGGPRDGRTPAGAGSRFGPHRRAKRP